MASQYKVLADSLHVRTGPGLDTSTTGKTLQKGQTVDVSETTKDADGRTWVKHSLGWSSAQSASNTYMQKVGGDTPAAEKNPAKTQAETAVEGNQFTTDINQLVVTKNIYQNLSNMTDYKLTSLRNILGVPHQFLWTADHRVQGSSFGRMYTENILMDMPICYIIPGGPRFLTGKGITKQDRNGLTQVLAEIANSAATEIEDAINRILDGKVARYFSFATQYAEYMKIVNTLNRTAALYLGIQQKSLYPNGMKYEFMQWDSDKIEADKGTGWLNFAKTHGVVSLYYNRSASGMGESGSNSTQRSLLDGMFNKASAASKEASFLMGVTAGRQIDFMSPQNAEQKIDTLTDNMMKSDTGLFKGIMNNLQVGATTVISGANMLLPEMWNDSNFMRSYTLDVHLATPYGDPEAYYLNIMVPINFIISLAMPRQFGANGYYSPFLIQANAKGVFNCDMGIVDSISISRFGQGDSISRNGLPLEVQLTITFKQLYNSLSVNHADNYASYVNNIGLLDFLANFSAINLNEPDISRKISMFVASKINKYADIPANVVNVVYDRFRDAMVKSFGR